MSLQSDKLAMELGLERRERCMKRKERDERLARRDAEYAALGVSVKIEMRDGVRIETRGVCPGGPRHVDFTENFPGI